MKQTVLLIIFLLTISITRGQNQSDLIVRCITASKYLKTSSTATEKTIVSPASLCYNDHYFVFYTKETGEVGFEIQQPVYPPELETDGELKGYLVYTFLSAESASSMSGYYSVQIYMGQKKIAVISYARRDVAYIIQSNGFAGNKENLATFTKIRKIIEDTIPNPNLKENPKMKYCQATTQIDVNDYVNKRLNWVIDNGGSPNRITCSVRIGADGKVSVVGTGCDPLGAPYYSSDSLSKVREILNNMPNWKPAIDEKGKPISSSCSFVIVIPQKRE